MVSNIAGNVSSGVTAAVGFVRNETLADHSFEAYLVYWFGPDGHWVCVPTLFFSPRCGYFHAWLTPTAMYCICLLPYVFVAAVFYYWTSSLGGDQFGTRTFMGNDLRKPAFCTDNQALFGFRLESLSMGEKHDQVPSHPFPAIMAIPRRIGNPRLRPLRIESLFGCTSQGIALLGGGNTDQ